MDDKIAKVSIKNFSQEGVDWLRAQYENQPDNTGFDQDLREELRNEGSDDQSPVDGFDFDPNVSDPMESVVTVTCHGASVYAFALYLSHYLKNFDDGKYIAFEDSSGGAYVVKSYEICVRPTPSDWIAQNIPPHLTSCTE